jgi:DNA polymerase V
MEIENFSSAAYKGSKSFGQWDIPTANATGFGAPADEYMDRGIDLNEQLIRNKPATFFMKVNSNSMIGAGIHMGDVVIVDRSIKPSTGQVVIAV